MNKTMTFYYDFLSPYTYLAYTQFPKLIEEHSVEIAYVPVSILNVMKLVNNTPTTLECRPKAMYAAADLNRWANKYSVEFSFNAQLMKINASLLTRGAIVAQDLKVIDAYNHAVFMAVWGRNIDISETELLEKELVSAGVSAAKLLLEKAESTEIKERLDENNKQAADVGVFGSPTLQVGSELFFGNDRLEFVSDALKRFQSN